MDRGRFKGINEGMPPLNVINQCRSHPNSQQVYLSAIEGYVPNRMLCAIRAFLEFCYIARHEIITERTLVDLEDALSTFMSIGQFSRRKVSDKRASHFHDNILPTIIPPRFVSLGLQMDFVHPLQRRSTSRLSKSHGAGVTVTSPSSRYFSPINASTNWQWRK